MADGDILMGVIGAPHGVRGLVRVRSFTQVPADLTQYNPLRDARGRSWTLAWKGEGLAEMRDESGTPLADRTAAEKLTNLQLFAPRDRMPPTKEDDFYIADLIGLRAVGTDGAELGQVSAVHDYGAGSSLEIVTDDASIMVPFTHAVVPTIDIAGGTIIVHPPAEIDGREIAA